MYIYRAFLLAQMVKNPPSMQETQVQSLSHEDPLEKRMATHYSILARRIPRTEKPGGLQSMGLQRFRHAVSNSHTDMCIYTYGLSTNGNTYIFVYYTTFLFSMNKNLKDSSALELPGHHYGPSLQGIHGSDAHDSLK